MGRVEIEKWGRTEPAGTLEECRARGGGGQDQQGYQEFTEEGAQDWGTRLGLGGHSPAALPASFQVFIHPHFAPKTKVGGGPATQNLRREIWVGGRVTCLQDPQLPTHALVNGPGVSQNPESTWGIL